MKLAELGEFGLIERIRARAHSHRGVIRGIGDDAAELSVPEGHHLLTSTDLLVEDVHFRLDWTDPASLGRKAVAVNVSDIAAMGGRPCYLYLGLACPGSVETTDLDAFLEGVLAAAEAYGVALVGGDTCKSPGPWMLSVTVEGVAPTGCAVGRDGASADEVIMVSGTLGDSALALSLLRQGLVPDPLLACRHHRPEPRIALGRALASAGLATAMIDISDGLKADLEHILQASGLSGSVFLEQLPLSAPFQQHLERETASLDLAIAGGEDYELLLTVPAERVAEAIALGDEVGVPLTPVGRTCAGPGPVTFLDANGVERTILVRGYDHFCPVEGQVTR